MSRLHAQTLQLASARASYSESLCDGLAKVPPLASLFAGLGKWKCALWLSSRVRSGKLKKRLQSRGKSRARIIPDPLAGARERSWMRGTWKEDSVTAGMEEGARAESSCTAGRVTAGRRRERERRWCLNCQRGAEDACLAKLLHAHAQAVLLLAS